MSNLLIKCMAVLTMTGEDGIIHRGEIAIRGGEICHVGASGSTPGDFKADRILDCPGMVAMPGLVNCHTHAAMTMLRGYADDMPLMQWLKEKIWPMEDHLTAEDIYQGTLLSCAEMIKGGTTTFVDMYFEMEQVARAVEESGLRAVLSRGMAGFGPNAEKAMRENIELVEKWNGRAGGRITVRFGPHAPYTCPPDYLKRVIEEAKRLGVGIHIHLAETLDEINEISEKYDKSPIRLMEETGLFELPVLAAHCVHVDDKDIEILARRKVGIAHNPQSNMKLASGIAPVSRMLEAGATVGLGTDGASSNNNLDLLEEVRTAAFLQKLSTGDASVLPAYQVLSMATAGGAKALGLEEQIGCIKPGYKADMILFDMHKPHLYPLYDIYAQIAYAALSSDVATVIIDGQIVMENRRILTLDEEAVMQAAGRSAKALVERKNASQKNK
ncbi:5-methylthioadenosine/S-adenosylhomocysteine deaminase [Desulfotomaculum arcticum]|uniref:5-methylthioadenosine/S-adenosylhomocysteine deaminase n=1 Tax=Desulfotruncus arcticus DSM 17038 TaxID=1121424 RepID=A0A1I2RPP2_9FIRM|nr:amidohydrolase [Desulfotruncus arcticus]SFG39811.1 5-methylthioadenosine/S-adenosylhomocysteine deaminase [Desulfotomaculum arcticum] [Desulfotruncus arcticus DSM 17038]